MSEYQDHHLIEFRVSQTELRYPQASKITSINILTFLPFLMRLINLDLVELVLCVSENVSSDPFPVVLLN